MSPPSAFASLQTAPTSTLLSCLSPLAQRWLPRVSPLLHKQPQEDNPPLTPSRSSFCKGACLTCSDHSSLQGAQTCVAFARWTGYTVPDTQHCFMKYFLKQRNYSYHWSSFFTFVIKNVQCIQRSICTVLLLFRIPVQMKFRPSPARVNSCLGLRDKEFRGFITASTCVFGACTLRWWLLPLYNTFMSDALLKKK